MHVKLQLVVCTDNGREEPVTDIVRKCHKFSAMV
jgi:hypothetical protein